MGNGSFDGTKFTLFATFEYTAISHDFDQWQRAFQAASEVLFDATDGQMSIAKITVGNRYAGQNKADIFLSPVSGDSSTTGPMIPNLPFRSMILRDDERGHPGVIVHEMGHYLFALKDEYKSESGSGFCTNDAAGESACIMEFARNGLEIDPTSGLETDPGNVSEFCCPENHSIHNFQEQRHGESCWETIVRLWGAAGEWGTFSISGPPPGSRPDSSPPGEKADPIEWVQVRDENRFYVVADASSTASDLVQLAGVARRLGTDVSFVILLPANAAAAWAQTFAQIPQSLQPANGFCTMSYTIETLLQLVREGAASANQRVLWLASELSPPDEVAELATAMRRDGAFNHAVARYGGPVSVRELVWQTNGVHRQLFAPATPLAQVHEAAAHLAATFELFEPWGRLDGFSGNLPTAPDAGGSKGGAARPYSAADLKRLATRPACPNVWAFQFDYPVLVEADAESLAFALCTHRESALRMYVQRPDGRVVPPRSAAMWEVGERWQLMIIDRPKRGAWQGRWLIRIERDDYTEVEPLELLAYARNPRIRTALHVESQGKSLILKAGAYAPRPVAHVEPVVAQLTQYEADGQVHSTQLVPMSPNHEEVGAVSAYRPDGLHQATVPLPRRPTRIQVRFVNQGRAMWANPDALPTADIAVHKADDSEPPPFCRVVEQWA